MTTDLLAVRDAFRQNFIERGEVGAALCVIRDGEVVVDLCGGWADEARTRPWTHDTLVNFYSVGKAIVATLVLQLVDQGVITLDTRVADIWPEFATGGKHDVTVRQALCHRAGSAGDPAAADRRRPVRLAAYGRRTRRQRSRGGRSAHATPTTRTRSAI